MLLMSTNPTATATTVVRCLDPNFIVMNLMT
jgi:hypothetical protein